MARVPSRHVKQTEIGFAAPASMGGFMLQDIRFASRQLLKSPGFSIVAVLTLALAIGASTAIFSAVDAIFLHPLPDPDPDRLMVVTENLPHFGLAGLQPSFSEFLEYRRLATCFSEIAAIAIGRTHAV
ncbi:MAG TPA: hypothetical protein VK335_16340 [Bryobacteraceae bacterium]|nr:hypothetical protein [Bryobacteraceae bacterium]